MFYEQLRAELENTPRHEMKIVMGDLNAKVGNDNTNYERAMGSEGCGNMNDNGERLLDCCLTNDLVIGGTLFPHPDIHKLTWCSPNSRQEPNNNNNMETYIVRLVSTVGPRLTPTYKTIILSLIKIIAINNSTNNNNSKANTKTIRTQSYLICTTFILWKAETKTGKKFK